MREEQFGNARLYLGDCREVIPALDRQRAVVTDPPYGIPIMTKLRHDSGDKRRGNARKVYNNKFDEVHGNDGEFDPSPLLYFDEVILWGANHYAHRLPHNGRWLVWDKRCGIIPPRNQADCELAWCKAYGAARMFRHVWDGMVKDSEIGVRRDHPTQKPIALMAWCLTFVKSDKILDPYMGSGTTGVASTGAIGTHFTNKLNIVLTAMRSSLPNPEGMTEALRDAREAIASLDEFALGGVDIPDTHTGESVGQYGVRDELLAKIDAALASTRVEPDGEAARIREYLSKPFDGGSDNHGS